MKYKIKKINVLCRNRLVANKITLAAEKFFKNRPGADFDFLKKETDQFLVLIKTEIIGSSNPGASCRGDLIGDRLGNAYLDIYIIKKGVAEHRLDINNPTLVKRARYLTLAWSLWHQTIGKVPKINSRTSIYKRRNVERLIKEVGHRLAIHRDEILKFLSPRNSGIHLKILSLFALPFLFYSVRRGYYILLLRQIINSEHDLEILNQAGQSLGMIVELDHSAVKDVSQKIIYKLLNQPSTKTVNKAISLIKRKVRFQQNYSLEADLVKKLRSLYLRSSPINRSILQSIFRLSKITPRLD